MKRIQIIGFVLAAIFLIGMFFLPTSESFTQEARSTMGVALAVIALLVTEALPIGVVCLLTISMMYIFGCVSAVPQALSGYTNQILYFVIASFGISEAMTAVPLSKRLLVTLMKKCGKNSTALLFAIMLCTALLSSIISNVAAAVVFIPVIMNFLNVYNNEAERASTARCYMIALPVSSMIGGMMTPAGSSINMLVIGLLEKNAGMTIPFVEWMLFGIPLCAVMLPLSWWICVKVFKPAPIEQGEIQRYINTIQIESKLSGKEKYVLSVISVMLVLWILSSWYPVLNITVVALVGLALFFIPGREIMSWKQFVKAVSWEAFFLIGTMISLGTVVTSSGLSAWIASVVFPAQMAVATPLVIAFVAVLTFLLLIPIPVAPALTTFMAAPLVLFATSIGVSPYILLITMGLCACNCYLLPLDTVPLMTFSTGSYKMFDMPKATLWIQLAMVVVASVWIPLAGKMLGIL